MYCCIGSARLANRKCLAESGLILSRYDHRFYNAERPHQALGYRTPAEVFTSNPVEATYGGMIESLTLDTLRAAGPALNIAPILSYLEDCQAVRILTGSLITFTRGFITPRYGLKLFYTPGPFC